ncbi:MAG TPA: hypothetical protein VFB54_07625 [Burkholderiales bacterium]|nr:hypothetical protein [Burkholderiales bacterium]
MITAENASLLRRGCYVVASIVALSVLCGCMPKQYRVRGGTDPTYQDDDVRFRATYYFRVFDYCEEPEHDGSAQHAHETSSMIKASGSTANGGEGKPVQPRTLRRIQADSLYRFRMTGKANSLTTKVKFESGTLLASEINPFGADVEWDQQSNRFRFKSKVQSRDEGIRKEVLDDIGAFVKLKQELAGKIQTGTAIDQTVEGLIKERLERLSYGKTNGTSIDEGKSKAGADDPKGAISTTASNIPIECKAGKLRRGYQVFGPEGWRTFDQDERLVLAMSASGRPLIDTLRELSDRVLKEHDRGVSPSLLLDEQRRAWRAQQALTGARAQGGDTAAAQAPLAEAIRVMKSE